MSQAKTSQLVKTVAYNSNSSAASSGLIKSSIHDNSNQENDWSQHRSMTNNDQWSTNQLDDIFEQKQVKYPLINKNYKKYILM